jgi:hypothetical protein
MAVRSNFTGVMTVPGNSSARCIGVVRPEEISHQLTVTADMLRRHRQRLPGG